MKQVFKQDITDIEHLRLTAEQADQLMAKPGMTSLPTERLNS